MELLLLLLLISASYLLVSLIISSHRIIILVFIQFHGFFSLYNVVFVCVSVLVLQVGVVGNNHAAPLPSEIYWKNKLPNTPMPAILHDLLHPSPAADQQGKPSIDREKSRNIYTPMRTNTISAQANFQKYSKMLPLEQLSISKYTKYTPSQQLSLNNYSQRLGKSTIPNNNAATNRQLLDSPGASLFFLEKDLYPGAKLNLHFVVSTASGTTFLPQKLAKVTPFSSNKLPEILNQFAINPNSEEAKIINEIIMDCEEPAIENEEKYCATSLEFTIGSGVRPIVSVNLVSCHSLPYLYAVFFCHATPAHTTRAFVVPLVGVDGTKIKAAAVCHNDTTKRDTVNVAFQAWCCSNLSLP
ncbi:hypothetical protein MKX01_004826 [Papaver californicum]|nr:hypothetical protein MKX01_004826 [Papaver californicum]